MTERVPPVNRESLSQPEQESYDSLANVVKTMFGAPEQSPFTYTRSSDDALIGPMPFLLAAPEAGKSFMAIYGKIGAIPGLPADAVE